MALSASRHATLHIRHLRLLPTGYESAGGDAQRLTLAFFALSALDLLGAAARGKIDAAEKREWCEWIWAREAGEQ